MELWRSITGYEGCYEVSNLGRVRSLDRVDCAGRKLRGQIRQPNASHGYLSVSLYADGKETRHLINRLVLCAFIGPPRAGQQAAHEDGDRGNNLCSNLQWQTPKENNADKKRHGTEAFGEQRTNAKLTAGQVVFIRGMLRRGATEQSLADVFPVARTTIHKIKTGRKWGHTPQEATYAVNTIV